MSQEEERRSNDLRGAPSFLRLDNDTGAYTSSVLLKDGETFRLRIHASLVSDSRLSPAIASLLGEVQKGVAIREAMEALERKERSAWTASHWRRFRASLKPDQIEVFEDGTIEISLAGTHEFEGHSVLFAFDSALRRLAVGIE